MNPFLISLSIISMEAYRAEKKVLSAIGTPPSYTIQDGPLASIIIPVYNEEKYLPILMQALHNQTYQNTEIIVVDNVSNDNTTEIATEMGATVLTNPQECYINLSRNIGADNSRGKYLVWTDADILPEHDVIEKSIDALESRADLVYPCRCSSDNHILSTIRIIGNLLDTNNGLSIGGGYIATRRDVYDAVGGWDESINPLESHQEDGKSFASDVAQAGYKIEMLRGTYIGVSSRRFKGEGTHNYNFVWKNRAIRKYS